MSSGGLSHEPGQGRLPGSGGTPEHHGGDTVRFHEPPEQTVSIQQGALPDDLIEDARP